MGLSELGAYRCDEDVRMLGDAIDAVGDARSLDVIRSVISKTAREYGVEIYRVILFGSRARGDCRGDSDWDVLVVTGCKLDKKYRVRFAGTIVARLAKQGIDVDVVVVDRKYFERYRSDVGDITYYAVQEGIVI